MANSIAKRGFVALLAAGLLFFAVAMFMPQSAYADQGWNSDTKGFWYQYDSNKKHYHKSCWKQIDGQWYYFQKNGYAQEGWIKSGKLWYYLDGSTDIPVAKYTAMQSVSDKYAEYAKFSDNKVHKKPAMSYGENGFLFDGGQMYYLNPSTGAMKTGWIELKSGKAKGWLYANNSGALATGWKVIGKAKYYFGKGDEKGYVAATGWQDIGNSKYYFNDNCAMVTGWKQLGGKWYYFQSTGAMITNKWVGDYYLQADGTMVTNAWIGRYHVDENGKWDKTRTAVTS